MKLELWQPAELSKITQGFYQNFNSFYKENELAGHTGVDWNFNFNDNLLNVAENAFCYSVLNRDNPDLTKYRAVYTLVELGDVVYEISYGHCNKIFAEVGKTYSVSDILATAGNTGDVFFNGKAPNAEERAKGLGTHLHFQMRLCKKVLITKSDKRYLMDGFGIYKKNGYYYEVVDYNNGYNGCIDPMPFFIQYKAKDYKKVQSIFAQIINILTLALKNVGK